MRESYRSWNLIDWGWNTHRGKTKFNHLLKWFPVHQHQPKCQHDVNQHFNHLWIICVTLQMLCGSNDFLWLCLCVFRCKIPFIYKKKKNVKPTGFIRNIVSERDKPNLILLIGFFIVSTISGIKRLLYVKAEKKLISIVFPFQMQECCFALWKSEWKQYTHIHQKHHS